LGEILGVDSPTDYSARSDTEHLIVKIGAQRLAACRQHFGLAAYFNPAYCPRANRRYVVDYEGHSRIVDDITILLPLGEATVTADFDCFFVWVIPEANRHYMGLTTRADRGQTPETLTLQVRDFGSGEGAHRSKLLALSMGLHDFVAGIELTRREAGD
jgi:hypothetical protein